jgi:hypothetical protein
MPNYVKAPSVDLSCLKGDEFQVALRVAINDLRDRESIFSEFLSEAGNPDKSNWERTIQYSRLHLLFAQTIVSTLLVESDRRIITQTSAASGWRSHFRRDASRARSTSEIGDRKLRTYNSDPRIPR